jgi:hypothetical protein
MTAIKGIIRNWYENENRPSGKTETDRKCGNRIAIKTIQFVSSGLKEDNYVSETHHGIPIKKSG